MMCCSCVQCVVLLLLVVVMAASPSLCISSQNVAMRQRQIEGYEEVSVAVVWWGCGHVLPGGIWYLCVGVKGT